MIYLKKVSFLEIWLMLYFSIFNLYWIDQTYVKLGIVQSTFLGLTINSIVGFALIFYIISKVIGFKKKVEE